MRCSSRRSHPASDRGRGNARFTPGPWPEHIRRGPSPPRAGEIDGQLAGPKFRHGWGRRLHPRGKAIGLAPPRAAHHALAGAFRGNRPRAMMSRWATRLVPGRCRTRIGRLAITHWWARGDPSMSGARDRGRMADMERSLAGGGELGALMRALEWSATPIGHVEGWPQSLRTAVGICLASRFPIL